MEYLRATLETVYMSFSSSLLALLFGLPLGVLLVMCNKGGIRENTKLYRILDVIINMLRSVPILILIVLLFPLSKFLVGRSTGTTAAIIPMFISAMPFAARMLEQSLNDVDKGIVEAAQSMGLSNFEIMVHVMIPEAMPSLINGMTIVTVSWIGYSAIAGVIGGGGLGDLALQFGYYRKNTVALYISVGIIILMVQSVQLLGNRLKRTLDKRTK